MAKYWSGKLSNDVANEMSDLKLEPIECDGCRIQFSSMPSKWSSADFTVEFLNTGTQLDGHQCAKRCYVGSIPDSQVMPDLQKRSKNAVHNLLHVARILEKSGFSHKKSKTVLYYVKDNTARVEMDSLGCDNEKYNTKTPYNDIYVTANRKIKSGWSSPFGIDLAQLLQIKEFQLDVVSSKNCELQFVDEYWTSAWNQFYVIPAIVSASYQGIWQISGEYLTNQIAPDKECYVALRIGYCSDCERVNTLYVGVGINGKSFIKLDYKPNRKQGVFKISKSADTYPAVWKNILVEVAKHSFSSVI